MAKRKEEKEFKERMKREQFVVEKDPFAEEKEEEEEKEEDEEEEKEKVNVAFVDRKTKAERNKERRKREKQLELKRKERERLIAQDAKKLPQTLKEVEEAKKQLEEEARLREERKARKLAAPRRLGPERYVKPEVDFKLTEELPGNLRTLKSDYNLVKDRLDSMQRRGLIEYRQLKKYDRRYKEKTYELRGHKQFEAEQELRYATLI